MKRLSLRLSLIRAWLRLASPLMTLMKSNTTRRSHPMIRSRLRSPTSKSMTTVRWPRNARPAAKAADVVVLPTPPLPDVMTMTFAKSLPSRPRDRHCPAATDRFATLNRPDQALISSHGQPVVNQRDLHRRAAVFGRELIADQVMPGDADQFGLESRAEDARRLIAACPRQRPAAQGAIDVDVAVGDQLGAGADRGGNDEVGTARIDLRARPHRLGDQPRRRARRQGGLRRRRRFGGGGGGRCRR